MFAGVCDPEKNAAEITFLKFRIAGEVQIELSGRLGRRKFEEFTNLEFKNLE